MKTTTLAKLYGSAHSVRYYLPSEDENEPVRPFDRKRLHECAKAFDAARLEAEAEAADALKSIGYAEELGGGGSVFMSYYNPNGSYVWITASGGGQSMPNALDFWACVYSEADSGDPERSYGPEDGTLLEAAVHAKHATNALRRAQTPPVQPEREKPGAVYKSPDVDEAEPDTIPLTAFGDGFERFHDGICQAYYVRHFAAVDGMPAAYIIACDGENDDEPSTNNPVIISAGLGDLRNGDDGQEIMRTQVLVQQRADEDDLRAAIAAAVRVIDGRRADAVRLANALSRFGPFEKWSTGGGCEAYGREFSNGFQVMVTDNGGCALPDSAANGQWLVGVHNREHGESYLSLPDRGDCDGRVPLEAALLAAVGMAELLPPIPEDGSDAPAPAVEAPLGNAADADGSTVDALSMRDAIERARDAAAAAGNAATAAMMQMILDQRGTEDFDPAATGLPELCSIAIFG